MEIFPYICPDHSEFVSSLRCFGRYTDADTWEKNNLRSPHPSPLMRMRVFKALVEAYGDTETMCEVRLQNHLFDRLSTVFGKAQNDISAEKDVILLWMMFPPWGNGTNVFDIKHINAILYQLIEDTMISTYKTHGYIMINGKYYHECHPETLIRQGKIPLTRRTLNLVALSQEVRVGFTIQGKEDKEWYILEAINMGWNPTTVGLWSVKDLVLAILTETLIIEGRTDLASHLNRRGHPSFCSYTSRLEMRKIFEKHLTFGNILPDFRAAGIDIDPKMVLPGLCLHYHGYDHPSSVALDARIRNKRTGDKSDLPQWALRWGSPHKNRSFYDVIYQCIVYRCITRDDGIIGYQRIVHNAPMDDGIIGYQKMTDIVHRKAKEDLSVDVFPSASIRSYMKNRYGVDTSDISVETEILQQRKSIASSLKEELEEACPDGAPHFIWSNPDSIWVKSFYSKPDTTMDERLKDDECITVPGVCTGYFDGPPGTSSRRCNPPLSYPTLFDVHTACVAASISGDYSLPRKMVASITTPPCYYPSLYYRGAAGLPLRDEHIQRQKDLYLVSTDDALKCDADVTTAYYKGLLRYGPITMIRNAFNHYKKSEIHHLEIVSTLKYRSPDLLSEYST
jgi:hypothetical protein